jgi:hypothetical protein
VKKHLLPFNYGYMEGPHRVNDLTMQGHAALQKVIPSTKEFAEYLKKVQTQVARV